MHTWKHSYFNRVKITKRTENVSLIHVIIIIVIIIITIIIIIIIINCFYLRYNKSNVSFWA